MFLDCNRNRAVALQIGTMALVPQIADAVSVPVIAAGGIADGRGIAAAFALRLLLLRELPRSRKSLRATAFRATRPQSRRWNRLRPISKGSSAMCDGQEYLEEHRLKPDFPTRRVIATCCNSGMFLDFTKGHWLTMYRNRFPAGAPPVCTENLIRVADVIESPKLVG